MATAGADIPRGVYRHARIDAVLGLAAISSLIFIWLIAVPALGGERFARHFGHQPSILLHVAGGTIMLLAGAAALRIGLTRQAFRWHRTVGFAYLASGSAASATALWRSLDPDHTPGLSTGTLAAVWLVFAAMAWRSIRNRRFDQHREWMIRSYVTAWTFVFCRFIDSAPAALKRWDANDMIWFTWIVPILLCEVALQWRRGSPVAGSARS